MRIQVEDIPASHFGPHLSDALYPAARGFVRDDLDQEGALRIPEGRKNWHFTSAAYAPLAAWWNHGGAEPLLITGPAGCGKTSLVLAFCERLRMPVVSFTARPRMDRRELIGRWVMRAGSMQWVDGPAALAWKHGYVLLVNEFSAAPPETWVSANDLLEGLPLENEQTGEWIERHPLARIVFTDNARGHSADAEPGYFGRHMQDRSVIDRLWHMRLAGLTAPEEASVLERGLDPALRLAAGEAAGEICRLIAEAAAGSRCRAAELPMGFENRSFALSTRTSRRLAELCLRYAAGELAYSEDPAADLADAAAGHALDRAVRDALVAYLKTILGTRLQDYRRETAGRRAVSTPEAA